MKRPPTKKIATSTAESTCVSKSCVRERISRNVQMIRLIQKMATKVIVQPINGATRLCRSPSGLVLPASIVATTISCAFTGQTPLSKNEFRTYQSVQNTCYSLISLHYVYNVLTE